MVLGAQIPSVLIQSSRGEDLHIVSGWRFVPQTDWYARPGINSFADLKGKKIGIRDTAGTGPIRVVFNELRKAGVDPEKDVTWVKDRIFAYHRTPDHVDAVKDGRVDCTASNPPFSQELEKMGCTLLLNPRKLFPHGRPMAVIAARRSIIEERVEDLRAFIRAILRGFWFERDPENFSYLTDLEKRLRAASPSEDEQVLRMLTSPERLEKRPLPIQGEVPIDGLRQIGEEMKSNGELPRQFSVESVLKNDVAKQAFQDLRGRKELDEQWNRVSRIVEKYGY
jgi:ABC-type nitrate/sulfonate/bicarbonate transport system substrate-binding protein